MPLVILAERSKTGSVVYCCLHCFFFFFGGGGGMFGSCFGVPYFVSFLVYNHLAEKEKAS